MQARDMNTCDGYRDEGYDRDDDYYLQPHVRGGNKRYVKPAKARSRKRISKQSRRKNRRRR